MKELSSIVGVVFEKLMKSTIAYEGDNNQLERNKTKAMIGASATFGTYILPGDNPVLVGLALGYTAIKYYQCLRDSGA